LSFSPLLKFNQFQRKRRREGEREKERKTKLIWGSCEVEMVPKPSKPTFNGLFTQGFGLLLLLVPIIGWV
jgi:hypothetical protein